MLLKGEEFRSVSRWWSVAKQVPTAAAYRQPADSFLSRSDAWGEMLIELPGPAGGQLSLDRLLETADGPASADRDVVEGRECIRLRYVHTYPSGAKEHTTQWHDVGRNYLICKLVAEFPNDSQPSRGAYVVTDFIEPSPGVVFPVRVRRDTYRAGELREASVTMLTDIVINKPVPAAVLTLPAIPRGTILRDRVDGMEGPIDSDWKPIGPMKSLPLPPRPPAARAEPSADAAQSTSEPTSSVRWVVTGSVAVLLLAVGLVVVRRVRASRYPVA